MPILTKDLQGELPNTVAAPVNSFVKPNASGASPAGDFLTALGTISPKVQTLLSNVGQQQDSDAEAEANLKALTADPKDLRAEIASGNYFGMANRRAHTALNIIDAQNRAFDISSDLDARAQRGELTNANAQEILGTVVKPQADAVTDPLAQKAFSRIMAPVMQKFRQQTQTATIAQDQTTKAATLFQNAVNQLDQIDKDAQPGDDLAAKRKAAMIGVSNFGKNDLLLPQPMIDKMWGTVAQHYAYSGKPEVVDTIGNYDRGGAPLSAQFGPQWDAYKQQAKTAADKTSKDNLNNVVDGLTSEAMQAQGKPEDFFKKVDAAAAADPDNFAATKVQQLKELYSGRVVASQKRAAAQLSLQQEQQHEGDFVSAGATALRTGAAYTIPEQAQFTAADGKVRTYSRKDYLAQMYQGAEGMIDAEAQKNGWTPEQTATEKVHLYGQNGDVQPVYQQSFNGLFRRSAAGVPTAAPDLSQRLQQLDFLRTTDPSQYANLAGKGGDAAKHERWLAAYRASREFNIDPEGAFTAANNAVFNPSAQERYTAKELASKVDDTMTAFGKVGVVMGPAARSAAQDAVNNQIAAGTGDDDIVKRATESLQRTHLIVNGVPVHNNIPGVNAPDVAAGYLKDGAEFLKKQYPAWKDIPIAFADDPGKPGSYMVIRTDTSERISRVGRSFTGGRLQDYVLAQRRKAPLDTKAKQDAADKTNEGLIDPLARQPPQE